MIRIFEPVNALHHAVDYIWAVDFDFLAADSREDIIIPMGHIHIVFNYRSAYKLVTETQETVISNTAIMGQMKRAKHVRYGEQLYQIGILLTPLGFIQFFDLHGLELTERIVEAADVDPGLEELYRLTLQSANIEEQVALINHFLLHRMRGCRKDTSRIEAMLAYVERQYASLNIVTMAQFFGVSIGSLERFFKKYIGLTPKAYGDIVKFRKHVEDDRLRKDIQYRYYDQSHLIKTSKKFAGKTFGELKKRQQELTLEYVWHGQK